MKGVAGACSSTRFLPREPWETPRQPRRRTFCVVVPSECATTATMSAHRISRRATADRASSGSSLVTSWYIAKVLSAARLASALYTIAFLGRCYILGGDTCALEQLCNAMACTHQNDAITTYKHHVRVALDGLSCKQHSKRGCLPSPSQHLCLLPHAPRKSSLPRRPTSNSCAHRMRAEYHAFPDPHAALQEQARSMRNGSNQMAHGSPYRYPPCCGWWSCKATAIDGRGTIT